VQFESQLVGCGHVVRGVSGSRVEIAEIVDWWLAPDHWYFKVRDAESNVYILRHEVVSELRHLTFLREPAPSTRRLGARVPDFKLELTACDSAHR
jgi:hypothetical protein